MKQIIILLMLAAPVQAAQEIPMDNVNQVFTQLVSIPNLLDVASKIESRLTVTTDGKLYRHGRFIGVRGYAKWRYCFIVPSNNEAALVMEINALVTDTAGVSTVINPVNGKWFITNIAQPMPQEAMDWCTQ